MLYKKKLNLKLKKLKTNGVVHVHVNTTNYSKYCVEETFPRCGKQLSSIANESETNLFVIFNNRLKQQDESMTVE